MVSDSRAELEAGGAYARVVSGLTDTLREIRDYAREYADLNIISKLIFAAGHQERFEDLSQQLRDVTGQANLAVSADTRNKVMGMVSRLEAATAYVVRCPMASPIADRSSQRQAPRGGAER
jgi:hypothetical protein